MGKIPQHFIDELMARADIVEIIGNRVPLKKAGREFKACCPFHDEKTPSFHVVPDKQFYHCFGCGAHGTALGFLMDYEQLGFIDAIEDLANRLGMEVPREEGVSKPQSGSDLYGVLDDASNYFQQQLPASHQAVDYLKNRGLTGETAKQFAIGFAPDSWDGLLNHFSDKSVHPKKLEDAGLIVPRDGSSGHYDRFRNRIMFPIRDQRGRPIAFGGRVIGDDNPKYLNSPESPVFHKGRELYGLYEARQARFDLNTVLIVEGYMDVVALHQHGIGNVVATLGTATTRDHLVKLFRICKEIVFCFDGDAAGGKAAWRALQTALPEIREGRQMRFLFLPDGQDPDSLVNQEGQQAFEERIAAAGPLSEFLISHLSEDLDMEHIDGRATFAERAKPLIQQIPRGIYRDMLTDEVARAAAISAPMLKQHIPTAPAATTNTRRQPGVIVQPVQGGLVRRAVALIVHYPDSVPQVSWPAGLEDVPLPGVPLLITLLEELRDEEAVNTAVLLERWRDRENGRHLARLAAQECLITDAAAAVAELSDILHRITRQTEPEMRLEELLAKSRLEPLSASEKQELTDLLAART